MELRNAIRKIDILDKEVEAIDSKLLTASQAKKIFFKNTSRLVESDKELYFYPDNLEKVARKIFSMDNVYVVTHPAGIIFNDKGYVVGQYATHSDRSLDQNAFVEKVEYYLELDANVYVFNFYGMNQSVYRPDVFDDKVKEYWWRIAAKRF